MAGRPVDHPWPGPRPPLRGGRGRGGCLSNPRRPFVRHLNESSRRRKVPYAEHTHLLQKAVGPRTHAPPVAAVRAPHLRRYLSPDEPYRRRAEFNLLNQRLHTCTLFSVIFLSSCSWPRRRSRPRGASGRRARRGLRCAFTAHRQRSAGAHLLLGKSAARRGASALRGSLFVFAYNFRRRRSISEERRYS